MKQIITVSKDVEKKLINKLRMEDFIDSKRVIRFYNMPDLSRQKGNPLEMVVERIKTSDFYKDFDLIETPEVVPADITFDLFNFSVDHPARSRSDTYYVDETNILRTHTTIMWYYYIKEPGILEKLQKDGEVKVLSYGKVYRKDEIDRNHYPIFHQIDGLYLCKKDKKIVGKKELEEALLEMAWAIYGKNIEHRFNEDRFPYTDPSIEMEIKFRGEWLEMLGAGVVLPKVLENFGIDSSLYNGWAFGPGIERLAMVKMNIPDIRIFWSLDPRITYQWGDLDSEYTEISKYPEVTRDISFILPKNVSINGYYEIVRDYADDLIEEVKLLDQYENEEKFGKDRLSYTFRIIYRSYERTLLNDEINEIQSLIRKATEEKLGAELR
ncbi:MAG: hypothetical protein PHO80_01040 [Candidatus Gracilibacteria bacterium]|nr:hypothetical protein [Candidatus Gracilibacteria bacterium]